VCFLLACRDRFAYTGMNTVAYVNYSIHWPDPELLDRIKAAAKAQDVSPGAFIRAAAERAVVTYEKKQKPAAT
jgi:hypothetical protein